MMSQFEAIRKMQDFVALNMEAMAEELVNMADTGILEDGVVRKTAKILQLDMGAESSLVFNTCLDIVRNEVHDAALRAILNK